MELRSQLARECQERGLGNAELEVIACVRVALPPQRLNKCRSDGVRRNHMYGVMQTEYHHMVLPNEGQLIAVHGIFSEEARVIEMVVKRWLVRNDEIGSPAVSLAQHIHGVGWHLRQ
jgi:hypothetical protein